MNLLAYTAPGGSYPGFVSINREMSGDVTVTVRSAPRERRGVHVCAHARDGGPGRCVPGGPTCNNYCNMAPEKGAMAAHPLACTHVDPGVTSCFTVPAEAWEAMIVRSA